MSKRRRYALLLAIALMAASGSLHGCSSSGVNSAASDQGAIAKGSVTVSATFPTTAGVTKSLIPTGTKAIYVKFQLIGSKQAGTYTFYDLKLTPAAPSGNLKLAPGNYSVYAYAYDSDVETSGYPTGRQLAYTGTGGVVSLGNNTVNLTFLNGTWTLVDSSGNPAPLTLSNGTQLNDVLIGGEQSYMIKAAIDFSKPFSGGSAPMKYRFNNFTSAKTYGVLMSQFIGTTTSNALMSDPYNLTQKCSSSNNEQSLTPCDDKSGDQLIMLSPVNGGSGESGGYYDGETLYGSASDLLPGKGATAFTQNGTPFDLLGRITPSTVTGGSTISGSLVEFILSSASRTLSTTPVPAKVAAAGVIKSAQSANTSYDNITVTSYDIKICATKSSPAKGTWVFYGQPVTLGTATCYGNGYLSSAYDSASGQYLPNAGDFSYGLAPSDPNSLGDYCHRWDSTTASCTTKTPGTGEVYYPYNFMAKKTATKTTIDYGSFKLNFHVEDITSGKAYVYPFTAKGKAF